MVFSNSAYPLLLYQFFSIAEKEGLGSTVLSFSATFSPSSAVETREERVGEPRERGGRKRKREIGYRVKRERS